MSTPDPLIDAVTKLTEETTTLLEEYTQQELTLDSKVASAAASATNAEAQVDLAKQAQVAAEVSKSAAEEQATIAKSEADRASEISGLDTVDEAVKLAMKLPVVHAPLDCKLSLFAGRGEQTELDIGGVKYKVPETNNVKFSRASKAWLDGNEYDVDEPRYTKDGELLVEGQATNYGLEESFYQQADFGSESVNGDGFQVFTRGSGASAGILANIVSPIVSQKITISFDAYASKPIKINNISLDNGESGFVDIGTVVTRVYVTLMSGSTGTTLMRFYSITVNSGDWIALKNLQVEVGDTPTSYIPTVTAAVTRAADITLISSENKVSRWEQDSGDLIINGGLLDVGIYDISPSAIVSLTRPNSVVVDGVTFPPNTPAYNSKGQLVISATDIAIVDYQLPPNTYRNLKGYSV